MLKDCNIAFFIDVDNVGLKSENYFKSSFFRFAIK